MDELIEKNKKLDNKIREIAKEKQKIKFDAQEYLFQNDKHLFNLSSIGSALGSLSFEINQNIKLSLLANKDEGFFKISFLIKRRTNIKSSYERIVYPFHLNKKEKSKEDMDFLKNEILPKINNLIYMVDNGDMEIFKKI